MCGIYMIINNINGKKYIGKSVDLKRRLKSHQVDTFNPNSAEFNTVIHKAIRKYGLNNFTFSIIEECKEENLDSREIYWIKEHGTYGGGYNMTYGGEGKLKINRSDVIKCWCDGMSISEISKKLGHERANIIKILSNEPSYSREESLKRGYRTASITNGDNITQYTLEGKIIGKYNSISEASRCTGITKFIIRESLKERKVHPHGFIWAYDREVLDLNMYNIMNKNIIKCVEQLSLNGDYICSYKSMTDAAKAMGTKYVQAIKVACKDNTKTAYGYKWRYVEGDKNAH